MEVLKRIDLAPILALVSLVLCPVIAYYWAISNYAVVGVFKTDLLGGTLAVFMILGVLVSIGSKISANSNMPKGVLSTRELNSKSKIALAENR